nr:hypothetical protein [Paenibacillus sp. B01]
MNRSPPPSERPSAQQGLPNRFSASRSSAPGLPVRRDSAARSSASPASERSASSRRR